MKKFDIKIFALHSLMCFFFLFLFFFSFLVILSFFLSFFPPRADTLLTMFEILKQPQDVYSGHIDFSFTCYKVSGCKEIGNSRIVYQSSRLYKSDKNYSCFLLLFECTEKVNGSVSNFCLICNCFLLDMRKLVSEFDPIRVSLCRKTNRTRKLILTLSSIKRFLP